MIDFLKPYGGWSLVYFLAEMFLTLVIVQFALSWNNSRNWRRFRQNYAQNLIDRTSEIVRIYHDGLNNFLPLRNELAAQRGNAERTHYLLDSGTALRSFEANLRLKRNEIRQSMELGFVGISANLSETVSDYQTILDRLVELTSFLVRMDEESGLPPLSSNDFINARELRRYLYSPERISNKFVGKTNSLEAPIAKLKLLVINFAYQVGYAHHPKRSGTIIRQFRRIKSLVLPFLEEEVRSQDYTTIQLGKARTKAFESVSLKISEFISDCELVDAKLEKVVSSNLIESRKSPNFPSASIEVRK